MKRWPSVRLGEIVVQREDVVPVDPTTEYPMAGVCSFGRGLFFRGMQLGQETSYKEFYKLHAGDLVLSRLFGWEGAVAVVPEDMDGHYVSKEFPSFFARDGRIDERFLGYFLACRAGRESLLGAATGLGQRRKRVRESEFLQIEVPLPPREEQRRVSDYVDQIAARSETVRSTRTEIRKGAAALLANAFWRISRTATRERLADVAPLKRRPVEVAVDGEYHELGVRSFGRGVFHKPTLRGSDLTWQKLFGVKAGDIVISNIKAWEGAIAAAGLGDDGRVGSHRYLTLAPIDGKATADFLCFYLLSPEGLKAIGEASPGSADRNRTLGQKALEEIEVPVPPFERQVWFDRLQSGLRDVMDAQAAAEAHLNEIVPSILELTFCWRL